MVERIIVIHSVLDFRIRMEGVSWGGQVVAPVTRKDVSLIPGPWVSLRVMLNSKSAQLLKFHLGCVRAGVNTDDPSFHRAFTEMQKNEIQSLCVYIVTCLHVFVSYRWCPRAHWDEQNRDWRCTDLPPAVISPSSYQTNLICFLPPGDLQNDLVYDFASSVTSGIFFFFSHCLPPPPAQPSNGRNHRSRRHLWPHAILNSDNLHASQSSPPCNCDLSLLAHSKPRL